MAPYWAPRAGVLPARECNHRSTSDHEPPTSGSSTDIRTIHTPPPKAAPLTNRGRLPATGGRPTKPQRHHDCRHRPTRTQTSHHTPHPGQLPASIHTRRTAPTWKLTTGTIERKQIFLGVTAVEAIHLITPDRIRPAPPAHLLITVQGTATIEGAIVAEDNQPPQARPTQAILATATTNNDIMFDPDSEWATVHCTVECTDGDPMTNGWQTRWTAAIDRLSHLTLDDTLTQQTMEPARHATEAHHSIAKHAIWHYPTTNDRETVSQIKEAPFLRSRTPTTPTNQGRSPHTEISQQPPAWYPKRLCPPYHAPSRHSPEHCKPRHAGKGPHWTGHPTPWWSSPSNTTPPRRNKQGAKYKHHCGTRKAISNPTAREWCTSFSITTATTGRARICNSHTIWHTHDSNTPSLPPTRLSPTPRHRGLHTDCTPMPRTRPTRCTPKHSQRPAWPHLASGPNLAPAPTQEMRTKTRWNETDKKHCSGWNPTHKHQKIGPRDCQDAPHAYRMPKPGRHQPRQNVGHQQTGPTR